MSGLSSEWRVTKSRSRVVEFANALKSLRKVVGGISPNTERVMFSGMSYNDSGANTIAIDKTHIINEPAPLPDDKFDIMVGLASHEAAHSKAEHVYAGGLNRIADKHTSSRILDPIDFLSTAEEIYVDQLLCRNYPVNYQYVQLARMAYNEHTADPEDIAKVWLARAVYHQDTDVHQAHIAAHTILDSLTSELSRHNLDPTDREILYEKVYEAVLSILDVDETKKNLSQPSKAPDMPKNLQGMFDPKNTPISMGDNGDTDKDKNKDDDTSDANNSDDVPDESPGAKDQIGDQDNGGFHGTDASDSIASQFLRDVQDAMDSDTEDLAEYLTSTIKESDIDQDAKSTATASLSNASVIWQKSKNGLSDAVLSQSFIKQLEWINRVKNTFDKERIRGEEEGILDRRRLHKVLTSASIYKKNRIRDRQKLKLVLLLDASSSMREGDNRDVYYAAEALHKVVSEAKVYSYRGMHGDVTIEDVTHDGKFHRIRPASMTPSGESLLAVGLKNPDSLIIHFTDGEENGGVKVHDTLEILQTKSHKTQIVNILLSERGIFDGYDNLPDNASVKIIKNVDEFPSVLKDAAEKWFKLR